MNDALLKLEERVRELEALQQNWVILNKLHAAPPRAIEGMVVYADGTNWNPGFGAGLYQYRGSTWTAI